MDLSDNHMIHDIGIAALANAVMERFQDGHTIEVKREGDYDSGKKIFGALRKIKNDETQIDISGDTLGDACAAAIAKILPREQR